MKVITSNNTNNGSLGGPGKGRINPPIPLERAESRSLTKGEYLAYKLRNDPADDSSPTYELTVPYFSTGTCEEWIKFRANVDKVLQGQHQVLGSAPASNGRCPLGLQRRTRRTRHERDQQLLRVVHGRPCAPCVPQAS